MSVTFGMIRGIGAFTTLGTSEARGKHLPDTKPMVKRRKVAKPGKAKTADQSKPTDF